MKSKIIKTASKTVFGLTAILIAIMTLNSNVNADECDHIDSLAKKIQRKTRLLVKQTVHYRHTPQYRALVRETSALSATATHIREVAHFENNLYHLEADLAKLDRCFHRLESLFDATEIKASFGHGHIHGSTRHVKALLNSIEDYIHHIQDDVRTLRRTNEHVRRPIFIPTAPAQRPVYSGYRPSYRPTAPGCQYGSRKGAPRTSGYRTGGISFSIGGGSSRMNFGF